MINAFYLLHKYAAFNFYFSKKQQLYSTMTK